MGIFGKKQEKKAPKTERRLLRFTELGKLNYYVNRYGLRIIRFNVLPQQTRTVEGTIRTMNYYVLCEGVFPDNTAKNNGPATTTMTSHEQNN